MPGLLFAMLSVSPAVAQTATLDALSGAAEQAGRPRPRTLQLCSTKPDSITNAPANLRSPL